MAKGTWDRGWYSFIDEKFDEFFDQLVDDIVEQSDGTINKSQAREIIKDYMDT